MDASAIVLRVVPEEIMYVNNIFEGYDHLCVVSTCDGENGILNLSVSPHYLEEVLGIVRGLKDEIELQILEIRP